MHEIPQFMAREFRVRGGREHTAIAGHSDAGRSALYIGLRNPDMYGVIFASNPWMFESDRIMRALDDCYGDFICGLLGAVGSEEWDPAMINIGRRGAVEPTEAIVQAMDEVCGSTAIHSMVNEFTAHDAGQTAIRLTYSEDTRWPYTLTGSTLLVDLLSDAGVPCDFVVIEGVEVFRDRHFEDYLLPFVIDGFDRLSG